ncbi:MAG: hypothetical protein Q9187_001145 [Circinaria calcarea]
MTRREWMDHEFAQHRVNHHWSCPQCSISSYSPEGFKKHLNQEHLNYFTPSQMDAIANAAIRTCAQPVIEQICPFCLITPGDTARKFAAHVGRHMQETALSALPPFIGSDVNCESLEEEDHDEIDEKNTPQEDLRPSSTLPLEQVAFGKGLGPKPAQNQELDSRVAATEKIPMEAPTKLAIFIMEMESLAGTLQGLREKYSNEAHNIALVTDLLWAARSVLRSIDEWWENNDSSQISNQWEVDMDYSVEAWAVLVAAIKKKSEVTSGKEQPHLVTSQMFKKRRFRLFDGDLKNYIRDLDVQLHALKSLLRTCQFRSVNEE